MTHTMCSWIAAVVPPKREATACLDMACCPPLTNYCRDLQAFPRSTHPLLEPTTIHLIQFPTASQLHHVLCFLAAVRFPFRLRAIGTEHPSIYATRRCQRPFKPGEPLAYTSLVQSTAGYKCFVALQHQASNVTRIAKSVSAIHISTHTLHEANHACIITSLIGQASVG